MSKNTSAIKKSQLGQFFTPARTAQFMAGLFANTDSKTCQLLDAGAGIGSLSSAFLERCVSGGLSFNEIKVTAFELDNQIHEDLNGSFLSYMSLLPLFYEIQGGDFIEEAVSRVRVGDTFGFTHAILNPPYKKINSNSRHRLLLRQAKIETVNLYSAFVALALSLLKPEGQLVAIIPRSFCNGPYYRPFRNFVLENSAIRHIHLFESRNRAFRDDDVLQENVIILLERDGQQDIVKVTTSTDDSFSDLTTHTYPFERIVIADDSEHFIHVPTSSACNAIELSNALNSLEEIGINVSTGPVVDFRMKKHLRDNPESGSIPLLYPGHFSGQNTEWPKIGLKKPNAIQRNAETEKWLFPTGFYCIVRRFSSKEEKRRIVASLVRPCDFGNAEVLGFENHLNVFHENKKGLPEALARGLTIFLNSTAVDEYFRRFSGHTQVNATDLKLLKYPSRAELIALGEKNICVPSDQKTIDRLVEAIKKQ